MKPLEKMHDHNGQVYLALNGRAVAKLTVTEEDFDRKLSAATAAPRAPTRPAPEPAPEVEKPKAPAKKSTKKRKKTRPDY